MPTDTPEPMTVIAVAAAAILAAYALGSLSGSLLLGRLRGVDIRTQGSGNAGATNAFRTQGAKFALGVVAIDVGKGALAAWLGLWAARGADAGGALAWLAYATAFAAAVGHIWPVWHGFRGGKGAATVLGGILVLWPAVVAPLFAFWGLWVILSGYVGLSTILAAAAFAVAGALPLADASPERTAYALIVALLVLYAHRANLARLRAGTESRFDKARLLHRLGRRG